MTITLDPLPMEAAQKFWNDKVKLSPAQFFKLDDAAKVKAFAVSGIAKGDELTTVFNAMKKSLDQGITFDQFKAECPGIFEKRGWTGHAAWRVDNIFRTNIQTAYNVGRYEEMQRVKKYRPYWQYSAVNDSRTRPAHLAMNGRVFPADHEVWDIWYPPNGFRCRCSVVTLSQREVDRDGLTVETVDPTGSLVEPIDPKTGNTMPARTLLPDPGFTHHPGKVAFGGIAEDAAESGPWAALDNLRTATDYNRPRLMDLTSKTTGRGSAIAADTVVADAMAEPVIITAEAMQSPAATIASLQSPVEIWLVPEINPSGRIRLTRRYFTHDRINARVMDVPGCVSMGATIMTFDEAEALRTGVLVYK